MNKENLTLLNSTVIKLLNHKIKEYQTKAKTSSYVFSQIEKKYQDIFNTINENSNLIDKAIEDIIDIIIEQGEFVDVNEFIKDVNKASRKKIKDKSQLINFVKKSISYRYLFVNPLFSLMPWGRTSRGFRFYSELNIKVNKELRNFIDCDKYRVNLTKHYLSILKINY